MENVMTYGMESKLRLPSCFVEVTDNEMEYLDGGISFWGKVGIIAACVGIGAALGVAIATGTVWVLAGAIKGAFAIAASKFGRMAVATLVIGCIGGGVGDGIVIAAILCS